MPPMISILFFLDVLVFLFNKTIILRREIISISFYLRHYNACIVLISPRYFTYNYILVRAHDIYLKGCLFWQWGLNILVE